MKNMIMTAYSLKFAVFVIIRKTLLQLLKCKYSILIIKANELHYFPNFFDKVLYMFRKVPLSIIRSISTLYTRSKHLSC
jgi:hypothetical protein